MSYRSDFVKKALELRKNGYSYEEISKKLDIAKSTACLWCNKVILDKKARERIVRRSTMGIIKAKELLKTRRNKIIKEIKDKADLYLLQSKFDKKINKLLCSFLYWAEGEKNSNSVTFINSDSLMIKCFLTLFRLSFKLDEKKFRALIHLHEYHNETEIKNYWSKITNIPLSQFLKSYLKSHTKKTIRKGYKGTISVRYYDYKIALELGLIYNKFAEKLIK